MSGLKSPGPLLFLGSGETAPNMQKAYHWLFQRMPQPLNISILETPAGFQPNSHAVAEEIADYLSHRLVNFRPSSTIIAARRRDSAFSPDDPTLIAPVMTADVVLMGPGSPTYAIKHLQQTLLWDMVRARHRLGAALVFASACTLAASAFALPVYEIYKVGQDLHWAPGLNLLADFGLRLTFVPHWNNSDGGDSLDTSHCYIGEDRFGQMLRLLPAAEQHTVVGIDEKTALILDLPNHECRVIGAGGVTLLVDGVETRHESGRSFRLTELGEYAAPERGEGIRSEVWQAALDALEQASSAPPAPPSSVVDLLAERQEARGRKDWVASDNLRERILAQGWRVLDTAEGPQLEPV